MRRQRVWIVVAATMLLVAGTGQAQEKGHVAGVFGWTFGEKTDSLYGARVGVGITDTIQIVGGVERMNDVLTGRYALLLNDFSAIANLDITGKVPATYGGVGARFTFPGFAASPFLEASFGATRTDATGIQFFDQNGDDVTGELPNELQQLLSEETSFTFVLGAGLRFDIGENFLAEATFEFFDVLANREDFRLNRLSFAAGFRF